MSVHATHPSIISEVMFAVAKNNNRRAECINSN